MVQMMFRSGRFSPAATKTPWRQIGAGVTTNRLWMTRLSRPFLAPRRQNDLVLWHNIHAPFSSLELWQGAHNQKCGDGPDHRPMLHPRATLKRPRQLLVLNNNGRSAQLESS